MFTKFEKELMLDLNLEIFFGGNRHKKKLKCSKCQNFFNGNCEGRGFSYKGVMRCMSGEIEGTPIVTVTIDEI